MQDTSEQPTPLSITQTTTAGIRVLVLSGEVDFDALELFRVAPRIDDGSPVRLCSTSAPSRSWTPAPSVSWPPHTATPCRPAAMSHPVRQVVGLVGLDAVLACYPTLGQALAP
ncbi:hypothetical protein OHB41_46100 [Streptomyces sp. NBC_01571]|nr:hypothetical protein [Streptomyces sp. NBC_01571]MCX4580407.1 hypothetical protein [Streptomyces sp. NBC_01571]